VDDEEDVCLTKKIVLKISLLVKSVTDEGSQAQLLRASHNRRLPKHILINPARIHSSSCCIGSKDAVTDQLDLSPLLPTPLFVVSTSVGIYIPSDYRVFLCISLSLSVMSREPLRSRPQGGRAPPPGRRW
jgi:hypothetical protein